MECMLLLPLVLVYLMKKVIWMIHPELSPINRYGSTVAKFLTVHRSEKVV